MYCSNCETTVRDSASTSLESPFLLLDESRRRPGRTLRFSDVALDLGALAALDQHLDRAVGQLQKLQHRSDGADRVDIARRRVVVAGVLLRDQQDLLIVLHDVLERPHGFVAADEERHDHVRKHDDVAQWQDRINYPVGFQTYLALMVSQPIVWRMTGFARGAARYDASRIPVLKVASMRNGAIK